MRTQWVEVWELAETKNKVFVCVACPYECVAVGKCREKLGDCPSSGEKVGECVLKMFTNKP